MDGSLVTERSAIFNAESIPDQLRQKRLTAMKRIAAAFLIAAIVIYALAQMLMSRSPAWGYVAAFAEAAMIGAIADWFAVVALFRHPLGIPVMHTAIIPTKKIEIAENLGEFIVTHFVTADSISARVRNHDPARKLADWLLQSNGHPKLAGMLIETVAAVIGMLDNTKMRAFIRDSARQKLSKVDVSSLAGTILDSLVAEQRHQELLNAALTSAREKLDAPEIHEKIASLLNDMLDLHPKKFFGHTLRAIVASMVPRMVDNLQKKSLEVHDDPEHPWRALLDRHVHDFIARLKQDPDWHMQIEQAKTRLLDDARLIDYLEGLWDDAKARMLEDIGKPDSTLSQHLQDIALKLGQKLATDTELRDWLNQRILAEIPALVERYRGGIASFITQEVSTWPDQQLTRRVELAIGRDLQFIRINGTLVGGIVGLVIYTVTQIFKN